MIDFIQEALAHADDIPHEEVDDVASIDPVIAGGIFVVLVVVGFVAYKLITKK